MDKEQVHHDSSTAGAVEGKSSASSSKTVSTNILNKRSLSILLFSIFLQCLTYLHFKATNSSTSSSIWIRPWAASFLVGKHWEPEIPRWLSSSISVGNSQQMGAKMIESGREGQMIESGIEGQKVPLVIKATHLSPRHYLHLLDAAHHYLQRNYSRQKEILSQLWAETEVLGVTEARESTVNSRSITRRAQASLLRLYLSLNLCPVLDTVLCDKRALSAHLYNVSAEELEGEISPYKNLQSSLHGQPYLSSSSPTPLVHPKTYSLLTPPFISKEAKEGLQKLPPFPLQKTHFLKDPSLNRGKGVTYLPKHFNDADAVLPKLREGFLLQEGVEDIVLLGEFKFTFRLYLFATYQSEAEDNMKQPAHQFYLSTNGNALASHFPYEKDPDSNPTFARSVIDRSKHVTNLPSQVHARFIEDCPQHAALPPQHRHWRGALALLEDQYKQQLNKTALRETIKRVVIAAVKPALTRFTPEESSFANIFANSSVAGSALSLCQSLYGIDLILFHKADGSIGVQVLEIQMEPNTSIKCPSDVDLYADLASGVWQVITRGYPDDEYFEKLAF